MQVRIIDNYRAMGDDSADLVLTAESADNPSSFADTETLILFARIRVPRNAPRFHRARKIGRRGLYT